MLNPEANVQIKVVLEESGATRLSRLYFWLSRANTEIMKVVPYYTSLMLNMP